MVEKVILGISVILLLPSLAELVYALSRKRGRFLGDLEAHIRAQIASRRIWLPLSGLVAVVLLPFSFAAGKPVAVIVVLCIAASTVLRWMTPPSILLLGVSGSESNALLPLLLPALFPAKVFHLLRDNYYDRGRAVDLKLHTLFTTSRASGRSDWEKVVSVYLRTCEKVLVDLRKHSGNLHVELSMITLLNDKTKVLYLIDDQTMGIECLPVGKAKKQVCKSINDAIWRLRTGY